jgi:hypothetical protein
MILSVTPELRLPSLMAYNHEQQDFGYKPWLNLYDQNRHVGYLWFTGGV